MIRPEHQFYIRPDLRKAASTKAESAIRPKQLVRVLPCGLVLQVKGADCLTDKNMSQWSLNLQYNVDDDVDCMLLFHRQRI